MYTAILYKNNDKRQKSHTHKKLHVTKIKCIMLVKKVKINGKFSRTAVKKMYK